MRIARRAKDGKIKAMRSLFLLFLLGSAALWAQSSSGTSNSAPSKQDSESSSTASPPSSSSQSDSKPARRPNLDAPRSDRVRADSLEEGQSSSKDSQIDLSPPPDDADVHPKSSDMLTDAEGSTGNADVSEFHPWDPHKAAKDIEVGDFYFKRKNYRAAEDRYREALVYKDNDAMATFRLAVCLEKMDQLSEAQKEYENYLKILPYGPQAADAKKAIDRLKGPATSAKPAK
jgi:tetratricopeptide (TPR) repeat protein